MVKQADISKIKILFISRHHPPIQSGGSRRSLSLVNALRDLGVGVTVVSPISTESGGDHIEVFHPQLSPNTSKSVTKLSVKEKLKSWIRLNFLLPDPDIRWANRVVKTLKKTDLSKYDAVFTSSPPESIHKVGYILSKQHALKWVADFRDFWLEDPLLELRTNRFRKRIEGHMARRWLKRANAVICVNNFLASEIEELVGKRVDIIEPAVKIFMVPKPVDPTLFHIAHTGSFNLSDPNRHIGPLLDFTNRLIESRSNTHLHIAGRLLPHEIDAVRKSGLERNITMHGLLSADDAQALQLSMSALILNLSPESRAIPGKYYEYSACNKPIFMIGGHDDLRQTLNVLLNFEDVVNITENDSPIDRMNANRSDDTKTAQGALNRVLKRIL